MTRFSVLVTVSYFLAAVSFLLIPILQMLAGPNDVPEGGWPIFLVIWIGWAWLATFFLAGYRHRFRALWLAIGTPFALYFPVLFVAMMTHCRFYGACV